MTQLKQVIDAIPAQDGDGVKIKRISGRQYDVALDPFLLLDEINSDDAKDYIGGFPPHPHRGFETITYMKHGSMRHRDHLGNEGVIHSGGVQWMTAAKGIIHSETPEQDHGLLHGFQLWLNLPAEEKMKPASYQDYDSRDIPVFSLVGGVQVKLIAGSITVDGEKKNGIPQDAATKPLLADVSMLANSALKVNFEETLSIAIYVYDGLYNDKKFRLQQGQMGVYQPSNTLTLNCVDSEAKILLIGGKPIKEPVYSYGPFVMNTREEIEQALRDFDEGGFVG